ncbi:MAG: ABC transporter ATP-binding protein [Alistipes sp.]|nr:ABC transporter ATP-binding protein [Alistipes sp.]
MALVSLRNVSVAYGDFKALENVDLDIFEDDFTGIIGPNGGGKTSLVNAITGMIPYTGKIEFSPALFEGSKPLIGYMPQQSAFDRAFPISVRETVLSGLQAEHGFSSRYSKKDRIRADEALEKAGLADIAGKQIGEISGGQLQRTLLCRAIIMQPRLLILDEPANFVDNRFENELYSMLKQLNDRMAIIMVSHDIGTISSVVKSIVCVNRCVHRHDSNVITEEQLRNYDCPIQIISHGDVPHTVLQHHNCNHRH